VSAVCHCSQVQDSNQLSLGSPSVLDQQSEHPSESALLVVCTALARSSCVISVVVMVQKPGREQSQGQFNVCF
jgi:hypothetical protein